MPIAMGTNKDETAYFVLTNAALAVSDAASYSSALAQLFGASVAPMVEARYPAASFATPRQAFIQATTDANFTCPTRRYLRALAASQSEPTFRYWFTRGLDSGPTRFAGAYHTIELEFVFGSFSDIGYTPSAAETALSQAVMTRWLLFAATGSFAGAPGTEWQAYTPASDDYLVLDDAITVGSSLRSDLCDFWDGAWSP